MIVVHSEAVAEVLISSPRDSTSYVQMHSPEAALHHHLAGARKESKRKRPDHPSQAFFFMIKTSKFKLRGKDTITHILFSQEEKVNIYKAFKPQEFRDTSHQLFKKQLVSYRAEKKEG